MFGERIKQLRETLNLTQVAFGAKLGMTNSAVHEWEHGKVEIKESSLLLIEYVFNVNPDWLRNGKGDMFLPALTPELKLFVDWMKSLSDDDKAWLKVELIDKINKYDYWLNGVTK